MQPRANPRRGALALATVLALTLHVTETSAAKPLSEPEPVVSLEVDPDPQGAPGVWPTDLEAVRRVWCPPEITYTYDPVSGYVNAHPRLALCPLQLWPELTTPPAWF